MRKTILTLAMMLMMALTAAAGPVIKATPTNKDAAATEAQVELKGDSIVVSDGKETVTVSGLPELQKMRDKINDALDDTLTSSKGTSIEFGSHESDLSPEDIRAMNDKWADVVKMIAYASIIGLLALVLLILLFRFLNRRNKYRVMEKAIENNYPLENLPMGDARRNAIYVQQPVITAMPQQPQMQQPMAQQPGRATMGTPLEGQPAPAAAPVVVTNVVNWRALMPAIRWFGWGLFCLFFGILVADPFIPMGLALIFIGLCKGFITYKEQQSLQQAWRETQNAQVKEPMRSSVPTPPPFDEEYKADDEMPS